MKIRHFDSEFDVSNAEFESSKTTFRVDIRFFKDEKVYHLVERDIWPDELRPGELQIRYNYVTFEVDSSDLTPTDITRALVDFLGRHKLYLYKYSIAQKGAFVSYASSKPDTEQVVDLKYSPKHQNQYVSLIAGVQLEDGIDYEKLFDIRIKNPINEISFEKLEELGYKIGEAGIQNFAILGDEDAKKYCK